MKDRDCETRFVAARQLDGNGKPSGPIRLWDYVESIWVKGYRYDDWSPATRLADHLNYCWQHNPAEFAA